jgi:nitric oxide reductase NorQ protein
MVEMATSAAAPPGGTGAKDLVNSAGWELRCDEGTSDKYYRVVVADRAVIVNWGRTGSAGGLKVHRERTPALAREKALDLTASKESRGYWLSRDTTAISCSEGLVSLACGDGGVTEEAQASKDIIAVFTAAVSPAGRLVAGSVRDHIASGLASALAPPPAPAAGAAPSPPPPRRPAARRIPLKPAGDQVRPNGEVYKPRDLGGYEDISLLRQARARDEFVLLQGPPGTGKTALAEAAFAGRDGSGMETISCTGDTTETDIVGTFLQDPATGLYNWAPGPLHRSVLADVPLFVDEIALPDPSVLSVLYALMDGRRVLRIPMNPALEPVPLGPGWFVMAACNPDAPGANMSEALLSRFTHHIQVETDWDLAAELGVPPGLITIARNLDGKRRDGLITWSPQFREVLDFTRLEAGYGTGYAAANLAGKAPAGPDRDELTAALRTHYPRVAALRLGGRYGR